MGVELSHFACYTTDKFFMKSGKFTKIWGFRGRNGRTVRTEKPNYLEPEPKVMLLEEPIETGTEIFTMSENR